MAEYLDKEAFKKSVEERYCKPCKAEGKDHNGCWCRACWVDDMLDEVECFQPSDVATVVRCKDCKHYKNYGKTPLLIDVKNVKAVWCHRRARYDEEYRMSPDDFCSYGETLGDAMAALRDKLFEDMSEEERIAAFLRETEDGKAYPAQYFYDWHHQLTGSCDMGRRQFARDHGIDVENADMTLREFLELTRDAYGGNVIRKVQKELEGD